MVFVTEVPMLAPMTIGTAWAVKPQRYVNQLLNFTQLVRNFLFTPIADGLRKEIMKLQQKSSIEMAFLQISHP